jgi:hypothetical protein
MEMRMTNATTETDSTTREAWRARDSMAGLLRIYALGFTVSTSLSALAYAQDAGASRDARPTLTRSKPMTAISTVHAAPNVSTPRPAAGETSIRPFRVHVPDTKLTELRRRIRATQWPEKETVSDHSQGVPLAMVRELARYWATDYDWRKAEAKLNALPQFMTTIDGLDIHFIHVRSKHPNALPLIVTHGWPGSIIEQLKIIDPSRIPRHTAAAHRTRSTW